MALIINKVKTFKWTVDYEYPVDDDFAEVKFKAVFKRMPQKFLIEMSKKAAPKVDKFGNELPSDFDPNEVCEKVIVGWEDVFMEDDKGTEVEVPFNKENLKNLLEIPFLSLYLVKSFYEGQTGKKLKNLEGQSTIS
tara:strand:+ start:733 stop:1140 length:408 start_codon:yes stop_codon:yes gene_type:complete